MSSPHKRTSPLSVIWQPSQFDGILHYCGFDAEICEVLREARDEILADTNLRHLCEEAYEKLFPIGDRSSNSPPPLSAISGLGASLVYAIALLARTPFLKKEHGKRNIPLDITRETLSDLPRWMGTYRTEHQQWGLSESRWLTLHFSGALIALGCLQFEMATLEYPYRFLRHIPTNQVAAIFLEETPCDDEGFPMTNNNTWATSYHETPEYFESNAINSHHGHVNRFPTRFSKSEWKITLDPSEPILAIHIPAGSPLSHEAVDNAFQLAVPFFSKYYPDIPFRGMTCISWMMDPQLFHYLPLRRTSLTSHGNSP